MANSGDSNWPEWILAALGAIAGIYATLRLFFVTQAQLAKARAEDRTVDDQRHAENQTKMDAVLTEIRAVSPALVRLERAERDILDLRKWKHEKADPYIGAVDVLKSRVDEHDRRLEKE